MEPSARAWTSTSLSSGVKEAVRNSDLFVLNLECCVSDRGSKWPDPNKPFFFRAPPQAVDTLVDLGVNCVTLANNHALDFGHEALIDTIDLLEAAGIAVVGAGKDVSQARRPAIIELEGWRLAVVGVTDHPAEFAAGDDPGTAYAELRTGSLPKWLLEAIAASAAAADFVLATPHWGPNMTSAPPGYVRTAAEALREAGVDLIAGHSSHVFHGVAGPVIYDMGDFIDDYAVDAVLRNDLGLLFIVEVKDAMPVRIEAVPLVLEFCYTRLADGQDRDWIRRRFVTACRELGTQVNVEGESLLIELG